MTQVRTRFAPSPTGFLHVGGAYSALLDFAWAKKHKGKFIIRIEDTDIKRFVKGAEEKIYQWLEWLGIKPDESSQVGGPYRPYRQSERLLIYQKYAIELVKQGDAYYCFCSSERLSQMRAEQKKRGMVPMYDRHCRNLSKTEVEKKIKAGEKYVIRMKVPDNEKIIVPDLIRGKVEFESKVVDDQVLLKSDGYPTYHLAVVIDDHLMKITHIVRGEEWLSSAPKHILLYRYFGWQPPALVHTATIRNPDKSKLSKRQGHTSIEWYIKEGYLPEALINFLCLLGWSHPEEKDIFSLEEFIKRFDLKDLSPVGPIFDLNKLNWLNGVYIRKKTEKQLLQLIEPFAPKEMKTTLIDKTIPLVKDRLVKLSDYPDLIDFFIKEPKVDKKLLVKKSEGKKILKEQLNKTIREITGIREWRTKKLEKLFRDLAKKNNWHVGKYFMATRIAITGKTATPPLFETMEVLGREKTLKRFKSVIEKLA